MNRALASMPFAIRNRLLAGGLAAATGLSMLCSAAPASAASYTYKVVPDLNTMKLSDWTNCDTACRNDLRSPDGVYAMPDPNNSPDITPAQWGPILSYMTNTFTWPVYAEDLYDCAFKDTNNNNGRLAALYTGRLDGWMVYREPGGYTCYNVIDPNKSNTLSVSEINGVNARFLGGVSAAGKIIVHARAYDGLREDSGSTLTRAQRIDAALSNANTGGLLIEQNPQGVPTVGWNIPYSLWKARSLGKRALLLLPPIDANEQNYLGKIHLMMKALEMDTATNLLGNGVVIVPAVYGGRVGISNASFGLPSNSLRAVMKHLKNVRAKGLSFAADNNFAVTGWLDAVERVPTGGVVVKGWACARNWEDSINVHIYVENVAVMSVTANLASEGAVAASCSSTGTAYRFNQFFPESARVANVGKRVYVYGISPFDLANNGLLGNGKPVP